MTLRHPRLAHAILALRPGSRPLFDFVVEDHGKGRGPQLVDGSMKNPPTQDEVDAVTEIELDAAQANKHGTSRERLNKLLAREGLTLDDLKTALV